MTWRGARVFSSSLNEVTSPARIHQSFGSCAELESFDLHRESHSPTYSPPAPHSVDHRSLRRPFAGMSRHLNSSLESCASEASRAGCHLPEALDLTLLRCRGRGKGGGTRWPRPSRRQQALPVNVIQAWILAEGFEFAQRAGEVYVSCVLEVARRQPG
jgi:hypothetical protein